MRSLSRVRRKRVRRVIGLISGTSADGVDAALVEIRDRKGFAGARLIHATTLPYPDPLREQIHGAHGSEAAALCDLNYAIGEAFASAALTLLEEAGLGPRDCDLIGSHGQTVCHRPAARSTLQIGEAAVIVERMGIPVVSDFRSADIAAGGEGAPLVPLADYFLFRPERGVRLLLNIGGIANLTLLTPRRDGVGGFDTGPGNAMIDGAVRHLVGGGLSCDRDGEIARRGRVDWGLMDELMSHPFLGRRPPKSTGLETFGGAYVKGLRARYGHLTPGDFVATLTAFTARSIARAIHGFVPLTEGEGVLYVGGGGGHNRQMMRLLEEAISPLRAEPIDRLGVPSDHREAVAFAILANETIEGRPGNLPAVTGARHEAVLGKVSLP